MTLFAFYIEIHRNFYRKFMGSLAGDLRILLTNILFFYILKTISFLILSQLPSFYCLFSCCMLRVNSFKIYVCSVMLWVAVCAPANVCIQLKGQFKFIYRVNISFNNSNGQLHEFYLTFRWPGGFTSSKLVESWICVF